MAYDAFFRLNSRLKAINHDLGQSIIGQTSLPVILGPWLNFKKMGNTKSRRSEETNASFASLVNLNDLQSNTPPLCPSHPSFDLAIAASQLAYAE